jgi:hypothetical protein
MWRASRLVGKRIRQFVQWFHQRGLRPLCSGQFDDESCELPDKRSEQRELLHEPGGSGRYLLSELHELRQRSG